MGGSKRHLFPGDLVNLAAWFKKITFAVNLTTYLSSNFENSDGNRLIWTF